MKPLSAVAPFGHSSCLMGAVSEERTTVQSVCIPSSPSCDNCVISYRLPNEGPSTTDTLLLLTDKTLVFLTTKAFNIITPDKTNTNTPDKKLQPWQPKRHYEEDKNSKRSGAEWILSHWIVALQVKEMLLTNLQTSMDQWDITESTVVCIPAL